MLVFCLTITWVLIFGALMQFFHIVTATLIFLLIVALAGVGVTVFTNPFNKNTERTKCQKALKKFIVSLMLSAMIGAFATILLNATVNLILCFFN